VAYCFCGVVFLLFVDELGERGLDAPREWLRLRLRRCAVVRGSGPVVLRSRADLCGSRALRSGSGCGRSQLLRSGPGCCS
jgi:hypothetical protein